MSAGVLRYLRDVLGVKDVILPKKTESSPMPSIEKWVEGGSTTSGFAWVAPRSCDIVQSDLINRMTKAIKLEPEHVLKVETSPYDIDRVLQNLYERGITSAVLFTEEFEPYISLPLNELKPAFGLRVMKLADPDLFKDELVKREAWVGLKKMMERLQ